MPDPVTPPTPFTFRATWLRGVDGDTTHLSVEVGFGLDKPDVDVRYRGINAPELHSKDPTQKALAEKAKAYVDTALSAATEIRLQTYAKDDFGRWIGNIWYQDASGAWHHLNQDLLDQGLAVPFMGAVDPAIPPTA